MREYSVTETAKLIRQALREAFPRTKFSIRSKSYSGGASIYVRWMDGPTEQQVRPILNAFEGAYFDGMQDMKIFCEQSEFRGERVRFCVDFVHGQRAISFERLVEVGNRVCDQLGVPGVIIRRSDYDGSGWIDRGSSLLVDYTFHVNEPLSLEEAISMIAHCDSAQEDLVNLINRVASIVTWEVPQAVPELPRRVTLTKSGDPAS